MKCFSCSLTLSLLGMSALHFCIKSLRGQASHNTNRGWFIAADSQCFHCQEAGNGSQLKNEGSSVECRKPSEERCGNVLFFSVNLQTAWLPLHNSAHLHWTWTQPNLLCSWFTTPPNSFMQSKGDGLLCKKGISVGCWSSPEMGLKLTLGPV